MHLPSLVLALLPAAPGLAMLNGHCSGSGATGVWKDHGICIKTSTCTSYGGEYKSGACPYDADDVKCCVLGFAPNAENNPCGDYSVCDWTANSCSGHRVGGECPGGDNFNCCHF